MFEPNEKYHEFNAVTVTSVLTLKIHATAKLSLESANTKVFKNCFRTEWV